LVVFEDGECGSSVDHANELRSIVEQVKQETGSEKVNMVGFSKGGLAARVYLEDGNNNVENLIMIGTPNGGAPLAYWDVICLPAANDLEFGSDATQANYNPNTNYYTIYGNWIWYYLGIPVYGHPLIHGFDDGLVPVWSVNSQDYFINIDYTFDSHFDLQTKNEYNIAYPILVGH
jgi:pimeloyl-ACP methyl ester carboxylesterase